MTLEEFRQEHCFSCGSLQCTGEDEWLEVCPRYREKVKQHKIQDYGNITDTNSRGS